MQNKSQLQYYPEQYVSHLVSSSDFIVNEGLQEMMILLEANENNLDNMKSQGAFKRAWNNLVGKNKRLIQVNESNLQEVQKISLSVIMDLEKQNILTREMQIKLFEKINQIEKDNLELKELILTLVKKIGNRFDNIDSKVDFSILIQEISQGIYNYDSNLVSLLFILSKLSAEDLKNERNMNLLTKSLENKNIISTDELPLKNYLEQIANLDELTSNNIIHFLSKYNNHQLIDSFIKALEYSSMEDSRKKFAKFNKVLSDISEEIEIEVCLSTKEAKDILLNTIVDSIQYEKEKEIDTIDDSEYLEEDIEGEVNEYEKLEENTEIDIEDYDENIYKKSADTKKYSKLLYIKNKNGIGEYEAEQIEVKAKSLKSDIFIKNKLSCANLKFKEDIINLYLIKGEFFELTSNDFDIVSKLSNFIIFDLDIADTVYSSPVFFVKRKDTLNYDDIQKIFNKAIEYCVDTYIITDYTVINTKDIQGIMSIGLPENGEWNIACEDVNISDEFSEFIGNLLDNFNNDKSEHNQYAYENRKDIISYINKISSKINRKDMRLYISGDDKFKEKLNNICSKYAILDIDEKPLLIYDDTFWGSAKNGFLITDKHIYYKNIAAKPNKILLNSINKVDINIKKSKLIINNEEIDCTLVYKEHITNFKFAIEELIELLKTI